MDLGAILDGMRKREEAGCKSALRLHIVQGRSAAAIKKACPKTWKEDLHEAVGLKKSTWYDRVAAYQEFGPLLLDPNDNAEDGLDIVPDYASIPASSLKLLQKVAAGTNDEIKHEWLGIAASTSFTDLKKLIDEKTGKEVCDCVEWKDEVVQVCVACGKKRTAKAHGDIG